MTVSLDDKYTLERGKAYLTGIEALVRLPILQHQRDLAKGLNTAGFISGYRGSPIGGYDNALWRADAHLKEHNIHFQPGVNEELASTALMGSQQVNLFPEAKYDGVFGLWYGKGPGLDRAMDSMKHANNAGSSKFGGVLAVVGDDHMAKSSTLAFQSEPMFMGASMPVLNPAGVQDILDFGIIGWEMSRYSGCWVGMKTTPENMDAAISADIDPDRIQLTEPQDFELPETGVHCRWPDPFLEQEKRLHEVKLLAAQAFARANKIDKTMIDCSKPRLGIVTTGKASLDVLQSLNDLGIDQAMAESIGLKVFKVAMTWPLEPQAIIEFAQGLDEILVVEEKRPLIEDQLKSLLYNLPESRRPRVIGKRDGQGHELLSSVGELTATGISAVLLGRIAKLGGDITSAFTTRQSEESKQQAQGQIVASDAPTLPQRQPWFCSGCPHNTSTQVPEGSRALAGIGCHFMVTWMDRETETFTQMGGEGASWIGQAPFTNTRHVFQNIGDGTYFHSGILAIRAAIASGTNITYKILYNDAVAMTGGQHVDGSLTVEQMVYQLKGEGVKRIAVVSDLPEKYGRDFPRFEGLTVGHRDNFNALQKTLRDLDGTSVIIYEQTCATEKRRRRKRGLLEDPDKRVFINERVCEGCGDCGVKSNCLSVLPKETELGRKRIIDQSACNKDYSCLKGFCPSFVTVQGGSIRKSVSSIGEVDFPALPEPTVKAITEPFSILLTGVGGMGVLTVGSIIGMAAHIEDKGTAVLVQTGLAQKFGAVTSHVRIANQQADIFGARVPTGEGQLLLGADLVVSSGQDSLARMNSKSAAAVVNNHDSPTADFTHNPDSPFPEQAMERAIKLAVGESGGHFFDATALGLALLGDALAGNMILLGYAWQKGLLPLQRSSLEQSIRLNGVAIDANLQAFLWGRRFAEYADKVIGLAGLGPKPVAVIAAQSLDEVIDYRYGELIAYQNKTYAERYLALVNKVRQVETELLAGEGGSDEKLALSELALTDKVVRYYFKLLTYKDEYEVARFYTNGDFQQALTEQFEGKLRLRFHLAPPLLAKRDPDSGHLIKREFGSWVLPVFKVLAKFKFLRGTAFDLFGRSAERKMERQLIADYEQQINHLLAHLTVDKLPLAIELTGLPHFIRGYGHVKETNVNIVQRRAFNVMKNFNDEQVPLVNVHQPDVAHDRSSM
ncbi:MAG: indolepyruvate ferredoxin oxidoreductase family protein [Porticoccaceae bacterium]|nr:indolepyruvate ferredoxin oxidoreductase family protein [Porticoccaceae bacterium]